MGRIKRKNNDNTLNKTKKIPKCFQKNGTASLSMLLTTGAYKKRIKDLMRNNRDLANELERARSQVSTQQRTLKNYVHDSNQIMFARAKLKDIATSIHKLVMDLDVVMSFLDVGSHLNSVKYIDQFCEDGQNKRMKIEAPAVSRIEESVSLEDTPNADNSTTVDAASDKSSKHIESPLQINRVKTLISGENVCNFDSPAIEAHDSKLSLTPVLDIQAIASASQCSLEKNSKLTRTLEDFRLKGTPQLLKKKAVENKESAMLNLDDSVKMQKFVSSSSKVAQLCSKTNALPYKELKLLNRVDTYNPVETEFDNSLLNKTDYNPLDMEITCAFPKGIFDVSPCKTTGAVENTIMQSQHKNAENSERENEITSEKKSAENEKDIHVLEPSNDEQTCLDSPHFESNRKKDSSNAAVLNRKSKRSNNVQNCLFFSSDSDTDATASTSSSPSKRKCSAAKKRRNTVIRKPQSNCASPKISISKQDIKRLPFNANTKMKAVSNFKTTHSSLLDDTALSLNGSSSHKNDHDVYDFDVSNPNMVRMSFAENFGNDMLGIKSHTSMNDKTSENKKFFPSKQNYQKDNSKSVTNIADSFPSSHVKWSENDENLEKCNSSKKRDDVIKETGLSSDSVDSEMELNPLEQKRVSFAALDSVYQFQRSSAIIHCSKRLTMQCTKKSVSNNIEESDSSEAMDEKKVVTGKNKEKCLEFPESIKKRQHSTKKTMKRCTKKPLMHSKEIDQCLKDKTSSEVDHRTPLNCAATIGETAPDDMTEIYTYVPSESQDKTLGKNAHHSSIHCATTNVGVDSDDMTEIYTYVPCKLQETKSINPADCDASMTDHGNDILCSKVKSLKVAKSGPKQNFSCEEDKSVTGLGDIISMVKKTETNRKKDIMASKENMIPIDDILLCDKVEESNYVTVRSVMKNRNTSVNHAQHSKSPEHINPLTGKKNSSSKKSKKNKKLAVTKNQIQVKTIPKSCSTFEVQQNSIKELRDAQEVEKLGSHSDKNMEINDKNQSTPRSSLSINRPRRQSKPVNYKEPSITTKMRREDF